jgi:GR25 family glycosyltransferase involved in LPS biosynthesis
MPDAGNAVEAVFINLDRAAERRAAMQAQLAEINLPYPAERLAAIDGRLQAGCPAGLRPGQYGCWLSHLAALERSLRSAPHLHVMEDDAVLSPKLAAVPETLRILSGESWDILYLDATLVEIADMHRTFEWVQESRRKGIVQVCRIPADFTVYGTHSYIVNSARKKHVYDFLRSRLDAGRPIDNVLASAIQGGQLKAFLTAPFLTSGSDAGLVSTVGYEGSADFLAWFLFRRLCFFDLGDQAAEQLAARTGELARDVARPEAIFGALCGYRVARWPNSHFKPS